MHDTDAPRLAMRATTEDQSNLASVAEALRRSSRTSFLSLSDTLRSALRAAAILARRGELDSVLSRYRADLAGDR